MVRSLMVVCALAGACSSSSTRGPAAPSNATAKKPAAAAVIDVRPFSVVFAGKPIARLHADGRTESVGENEKGVMSPGPMLRADGTIAFTKGGFVGRVAPDGAITIATPSGKQAPQLFGRLATKTQLDIGDSATLMVDDATIRLDREAGTVEIGTIQAASGPVDDAMRRTALIVTAAFYIENAIKPTPGAH